MPYKTFFDWAFDGNIKNPIPQGENIPDILKYNSPIHATFLLKSFVNNGKLNYYLNKYINNIGVRYIDKKDLFLFIKQCIIDFKINRRTIHYISWDTKNSLFDKLSKKFPLLKKEELSIACDLINNSDEKDSIYRALGIEKDKFEKTKLKNKPPKHEKISKDAWIAKSFRIC